MRYRRFGRTGLDVSEITFGAGWVGGILIDADDATRRQALASAFAAGINFVDTAASYGQGRSEEALGWLLAEVERQPYLSTKVGLDTARLADIPGEIERSLEASLKRLRRDRVDLLQLHNPVERTTGPHAVALAEVLRPGGVADGLARLAERGFFRFLGFTALGDPACCIEVAKSGRFDSAQVYYNLLNPSAGIGMPAGWRGHDFRGLMAACRAQDMAVMNIRTYAAGVLATEERHGREVMLTAGTEVADEEKRARAVLAALGEGHGTRAQAALRFSLANADVSTVVIGLAKLSHLDEALAAAAAGPLPPDALARLAPVWASNFGLGRASGSEGTP